MSFIHHNNLLRNLFEDNHFTDVTLVSEDGQEIAAHRSVLELCSDFLKTLLCQSNQNNADIVIFLPGVLGEDIKMLLQLVYYGQCNVPSKKLETLTYLMRNIEIEGVVLENKVLKIDKGSPFKNETQMIISIEHQKEDVLNMTPKVSNSLKCPKCQYSSETFQYLNFHIEQKHGNQSNSVISFSKKIRDKNYQCLNCGKTFKDIFNLKVHKTQHNSGPVHCLRCEKDFEDKYYLIEHRTSCYFKCSREKCPFKTKRKSSSEKHERKHKRTENKLTKCNIDTCTYISKNGGQMLSHTINHNKILNNKLSDNLLYKCITENCEFASSKKSELTFHKLTHPEEAKKLCFCPECGVLVKQTKANSHKSSHNNIAVTCDKCKVVFKDSIVLNMHRPCYFSCSYENCDFKTPYLSKLTGHIDRKLKEKFKQLEGLG